MKINMKRPLAIMLALILVLFTIPTFATIDDITLTIIHINDRHGRTDADPYMARLAEEITGNVLILDAGDALHGQTTTNLTAGESMVAVMNAVGYSAMVPGNHDFNFGVDRLLELSEMMNFPLLAANVRTANGELLFQAYEVFAMDGVTVGVFGIATPETATKSDPRIVADLTFDDPAETAREMVTALQNEGCDVIIALAHLGDDEVSDFANRSESLAAVSGIHVIIDAHSHSALENGVLIGDTLIAQTGGLGSGIGIVEISMNGGVDAAARLIEVTDALPADEAIITLIETQNAGITHITETVVGHTPVRLNGERSAVRTSETNLANIITDSMRAATGADIAFLTGGNIRASIEAGDITMGDVLTVLPFSNLLVTVELTGGDVLRVLEHGVSQYPEEAGQHIQVSGIAFSFNPDAAQGERVYDVTINGNPIDDGGTYTVATSEFLAAGGDGYDMLAASENLIYYGGDAEALADYFATSPAISAEAEGRVTAAESETLRFDDVSRDAWYFSAVMNVTDAGIMGAGDAFNPNAPVTADEMRGYIGALLPSGETTVIGENDLTRERLALMLAEFLEFEIYFNRATMPASTLSDYRYVGEEYQSAVSYVFGASLMHGDFYYFNPQSIVTRAQAAVVLDNLMNVLPDVQPNEPNEIAEAAFQFFIEISSIPRGSGNMRGISDFLLAFGEARGFETIQDEILNILIRKPGSAGRENETPIILQAHMDMVCEKNEGVAHDFLTDPIIPVINGDWVTANGTTLGADNGTGLAIMMAILNADNLSHPPIEALFTIDEETTSDGAFLFDTSLLSGNRLINLDSEDEGIFTVSSAAADVANIIIPIESAAASDGFASYRITVRGLTGGHSGVDIHRGFANANILMARVLSGLSDFQLSAINGGSAINAIPRECGAIIFFDENDFSAIQSVITEMEAAFKIEFPNDEGLNITIERTAVSQNVMSDDSLQNIINCILQIPNGVLVMSPNVDGLVQTSNNLGVISTDNDAVIVSCFARGSDLSEQAETLAAIQTLADSIGAQAEFENSMPAWPYRAESPLRDLMSDVFRDMYGSDVSIEAIHAGLECAAFAESMPDCDIISIGPDVRGGHSPDERLSLSSFYRTVDFMVAVLEQI